MPNVLDIFNNDAFGVAEMTEAVNLLPFQPGRLGELGLFSTKGIPTTSVVVERQGNVLALLPSSARGTHGVKKPQQQRDIRSLLVPHIVQHDTVLADDVQDVRAFGSSDQMETVSGVVADKQGVMLQNHEMTEEWLRVGAIQASIVDGDGSTVLHDLEAEFGVSRPETDFKFSVATTEIKLACMDVRRTVEDALGGTTFRSIRGFCGNTFWDALITHALVKEAFDRWQTGAFFRTDQRVPNGAGGFEYCNIYFENYRGSVGGTPFIPVDECAFVVEGVQGLFSTCYSPADYVETVNTIGRRVYSKQRKLEFDRGVEIETQSNPLPICNRPNTLVKGTMS